MKNSGPDEIAVGEEQAVTNGDNKNNLRRAALSEIDNAPLGWYHIRAAVVAGTGFFLTHTTCSLPTSSPP